MPELNGYKCFFKGKSIEVYAASQLEARDKAVAIFKAKKPWDVAVVLCEIQGKQVTHRVSDL